MSGNGKVFVSHTHADNARCEPLLAALDAWGVPYWFDAEQLDAGQQLSERLQQAITERDILLRVCTVASMNSYWMNLERSAFRAAQYAERKRRPDDRKVIDLVLDREYIAPPLEAADLTIDAVNQPARGWLAQLAAPLGARRKAQKGLSRRAALGLGAAALVTVGAAGAGAAIVKTRDDAANAPYPKPHTIAFPATTLDKRIKWYFVDSGGFIPGPSGIALAGDKLLVANGDALYALDTSDGSIQWSNSSLSGSSNQTPVVAGDVAYMATESLTGSLNAVNLADGKSLWKSPTNSTSGDTNLTLANGVIYMLTDDNHVAAYSVKDGSRLWLSALNLGKPGVTSPQPVVSGGRVYIGAGSGLFAAINAADGSTLWTYRTYGEIDSSAVVANGVVYVGSADQTVYAFDAQSGTILWQFQAGEKIDNSPTLAGNTLIASAGASLYGLDLASGKQRWTTAVGGANAFDFVAGPVVVAGNTLYTVAGAYLYALDAQTRAQRWRFQSNPGDYNLTTPIASGTMVYWADASGAVYALGATLPG